MLHPQQHAEQVLRSLLLHLVLLLAEHGLHQPDRGILDYLDRLIATFDIPLQAVVTCTGPEANDVALRMAQAVTGKTGIIATDNTYHGNTAAVSQLSTRRPPIGGRAPNVRLVPAPETVAPLGGSLAAQAQVE